MTGTTGRLLLGLLGTALGLASLMACQTPAPKPTPPPKPATPAPLKALSQEASHERYLKDLTFIASAQRTADHPHLKDVRDHIHKVLEPLGSQLPRHDSGTGTNIIATLPRDAPELVHISAHMDSVPGCPGADDNATGVAGVLEIGRLLAASGPHHHSVTLAFWDEEEKGLVGSSAWTAQARAEGAQIKAALVFDMIGYRDNTPGSQRLPPGVERFTPLFGAQMRAFKANERRADFVAALADTGSSAVVTALIARAKARGLPMMPLVVPSLALKTDLGSQLGRSDHASFWNQGYPAVLLSDTGELRTGRYHCMFQVDDMKGLDHRFAVDIIQVTAEVAYQTLQKAPSARSPAP